MNGENEIEFNLRDKLERNKEHDTRIAVHLRNLAQK